MCSSSLLRSVLLLGEEDEASPSIAHFVARLNDVRAFGYNSAGSERIWMKFGELRDYGLELSLANFGRVSAQKRLREEEPKFCFFCPLNKAWFHRLPVGQISRTLHKKTCFREVCWGLENIRKNLPVRGLFSPKKPPFWLDQSQRFPNSGRDFSEMITNLGKSWQVGPPVECWLSIDTVGMNSKWFPWPVTPADGSNFSSKILFYDVYRRRLHGMLHNAERCK